jgi:hypothetical protein
MSKFEDFYSQLYEGWDVGNESSFKSALKRELSTMFPGCLILDNDPNYVQGIPDLLILWHNVWAALECKKAENASRRPNQE